METILMYLDNMFLNMPKTPEVLRVKEELASMMEDKYNELMAKGKKENEAIGIVISEFGNLEELAEELGIGSGTNEENTAKYAGSMEYGNGSVHEAGTEYECNKGYGKNETGRLVSRQEAEEYMAVSEKTSKWIAVGVLLCIWSPIFLIFCGGIDDSIKRLSDGAVVLFGLVPLFIMIGIAVGIFIYNGTKMEKFEYLKKEKIQMDASFERELAQMAEEERSASTIKIIIGVMMCIFSVIPLFVTGSFSDNDFIHSLSIIFLLMIVGIAVAVMIIGGNRMECIKVLRQEGEFSVGKKD